MTGYSANTTVLPYILQENLQTRPGQDRSACQPEPYPEKQALPVSKFVKRMNNKYVTNKPQTLDYI